MIADKALEVLGHHGWYLVEQIVPFALVSKRIDTDTKSEISTKILTFNPPTEVKLGKPKFPVIKPETKLSDLVGEKSDIFFRILDLDYTWLAMDPNVWEEEIEYKRAEEFVRNVKTVNDCAKRELN